MTATKKTGVELIAEERQRQINKEGYNKEHDASHNEFEFTKAAIAYLDVSQDYVDGDGVLYNNKMPSDWEFKTETEEWTTFSQLGQEITEPHRYNPSLRDLIKAGALIAAEIDRLQSMPYTEILAAPSKEQ